MDFRKLYYLTKNMLSDLPFCYLHFIILLSYELRRTVTQSALSLINYLPVTLHVFVQDFCSLSKVFYTA